MKNTRSLPDRNRLTAALLAAMLVPVAGQAFAQETTEAEATNLDKVVVTGSLIPQTQLETFSPVMTITAEDIRARGFTSVADVLQKASVSTGGVQGAQTSASFTQGAETIGMFGLDPGYTKYLIDGRPMANYPALYNGSDTFNNISNIPIDLVESIEILPGGQSSLYGSDAIAGVINIKLKKQMDGTTINVRGGAYTEGGGANLRVSIADGFSAMDGRLNGLVGLQHEQRNAVWASQRDLTRQFNTNGTSPPVASRDFLINGFREMGTYGLSNNGYINLPAEAEGCANVTGLFGGTMGQRERAGAAFGTYCGSFYTPGYRTLLNDKEATQVVGHVTYDFNDSAQLYGDLLYSHEKIGYHVGSNYTWWGTSVKWGYFYDPDLDSLINLQRAFAPEEMGGRGFRGDMNQDTSEAYQGSLGVKGYLGQSDWAYDFGLTYTQYELQERNSVRWADAVNDYFQNKVLGPQLGVDPYFNAYPVFTPNYGAFYQTITPQEYASFSGHTINNSKTSDAMARAQVTNSALFSLPGGDAGLAIALEWGQQKWDYTPDPRLMDGSVWGLASVDGGGDRDRYAATAELRMPVVDMLTLTASGRYDAFKPDGGSKLDKATYSLGLEFRPLETLMVRGKYGTAFRAPTLSDQFQGLSGFYTSVNDYYLCSEDGFQPGDPDFDSCDFSGWQISGSQAGNVDLQPINADVWNVGLVWAPTSALSFTADYYSWDIDNEVTQQSIDALMMQEYRCRTGVDDINSPTCVQTLAQITRDPNSGYVDSVFTPKINVSKRQMEAATASFNYVLGTQAWGDFVFNGNYTRILKHDRTIYEGDPSNDYLNDPYYSTDPKDRATLSGTWSKDLWSTTLYMNWMGRTPNYAASVSPAGFEGVNAGKLDAYTTFNASVSYQALDNLQFSALVTNLTNEMPPEDRSYPGTSGAPYNSYNYDVLGRAVYFEARYSFGK